MIAELTEVLREYDKKVGIRVLTDIYEKLRFQQDCYADVSSDTVEPSFELAMSVIEEKIEELKG